MSYKKLTKIPPGEILEVSTVAELEAKCIASNEGQCYKYTGTDSGDYINGDLYVVELKDSSYILHHYPVKTAAPTITSIYKIYKQDGTEIPMSDWNVAGLADAYEYTKNGGSKLRVGGRIFHINTTIAEGEGDKFYVYDTTNGLQSSLKWESATGTARGCTTNTIGSGKTNSAIMLNAMGTTSGTIWYFIKNTMNSGSVGGCNDWYIGSTIENDQLRNSGLVNWFSSNYIWSSVEYLSNPSNYALRWSYYDGYWSRLNKTTTNCCFAVRSF